MGLVPLPAPLRGKSPKWQRHFVGPYLIIRVIQPVNAVIQRTKRSAPVVVHFDKLKACRGETPTSWLAVGRETAVQPLNSGADLHPSLPEALPRPFGDELGAGPAPSPSTTESGLGVENEGGGCVQMEPALVSDGVIKGTVADRESVAGSSEFGGEQPKVGIIPGGGNATGSAQNGVDVQEVGGASTLVSDGVVEGTVTDRGRVAGSGEFEGERLEVGDDPGGGNPTGSARNGVEVQEVGGARTDVRLRPAFSTSRKASRNSAGDSTEGDGANNSPRNSGRTTSRPRRNVRPPHRWMDYVRSVHAVGAPRCTNDLRARESYDTSADIHVHLALLM
jgi:hypothetical protein